MAPVLLNPHRFGGGAVGYAGAVLADSPSGYWRQGEASGGTMLDASGNARNGTYVGVNLPRTSLLPNGEDSAADYTGGASSYAHVANGSWMNPGATITLEAWVKLDAFGDDRTILSLDAGTGTQRAYRLNLSSAGKAQFMFWDSGGTLRVCAGATTLSVATNYYLAATYDGANARIYVNAVQDGTLALAGSIRSSTQTLWIGASNNGGGSREDPWDGHLDEVALYGTALSAARISAHYAAAA